MKDQISPKYLMRLIDSIEFKLGALYASDQKIKNYIEKWHEVWDENWNTTKENFPIVLDLYKNIDLLQTLNSIDADTLLKIAIDLGLETPDFIPAIPTFRNEIKSNYKTASGTFEKAFTQIEEHPDIAIGLVNSALESIIKEILKDEKMSSKVNPKKTLYDLTADILKEFQLFPNARMPAEIKTIGSSLIAINQSIEKLRSEKTNLHGKTDSDYIIDDPIYTYFVVNSVTTVGLFLKSFYEKKFKNVTALNDDPVSEDLPF